MFLKALPCLLVIAVLVTKQVEGVSDVGEFINRIHGIGGTVRFLDTKTISIENFRYDGQGVDVFLYFYAPGVAPQFRNRGTIIRLPSSFGESDGSFPNRVHNGEDITATLPEGTDVCDIGTLSVWCQPFNVVFGFVDVPRSLFINDGEDPCTLVSGPSITLPPVLEFDNCIPLHETLQLSWKVDSDNSRIRIRLCGCQPEAFGTNQYLGFGLSGSDSQTLMFGADPTITWVDSLTGEANAVDYHLSAYTQCRAGVGACPDTLDSRGTCTNDVTDVSGFASEGQQCISFTKPLSTSDSTCDLPIDPLNENQYIVWGVGGLGETAFRHFLRAQSTDAPIHFGRTPRDDCAGIQPDCRRNCPSFRNERIIADENVPLQVRIGPSGNERGYMGITGRAGWGIAWYINGTLIPELVVERGKTYTFLVEGGDNPNNLANYHPLYITDSISGGRLQNSVEDQASERVYAGFDDNGNPIGVGELCSYIETQSSNAIRENCGNLTAYTSLLMLAGSCSNGNGNPGRLVWTPDANTPDVVYYQCATHLNLGWRITVTGAGISTEPPTPTATTVNLNTTVSTSTPTVVDPETTTATTEEPTSEPPSVPPTPETSLTNVHAFCSVVVWEYSNMENLIGYDIRFLTFETQVFIRRVRSTRAFYIVRDSDKVHANSSSLVQVQARAWYSNGLGPWTPLISLGCSEPPQPPTCPPCICDAVNASSPLQRPGLYLKGLYIPNNSEIQLNEVGEGEDALFCLTDNEDCCRTIPNRRGQFYYPSGAQVPIQNKGQGFYRNRGDQMIRLNRRETVSSPKGRFCCEIPDARSVKQRMCVTLV